MNFASRVTRRRATAEGVLAGAIGGALGWLIAHGDARVVVALVGGVVLTGLALRAPGPFVALMFLVIMNAVPGVNLSRQLVGSFGIQDCAVLALVVGLAWHHGPPAGAREARVVRLVTVWAAVLVGWWAFTLARTVIVDGVPLRYAVSYGRDFAYFGLLVVVFVRARISSRSLQSGVWLAMTGVVLFALGQIVSSISGQALAWLVHPDYTVGSEGALLRVYSPMSAAVSTALIFVVALVLVGTGLMRPESHRWWC